MFGVDYDDDYDIVLNHVVDHSNYDSVSGVGGANGVRDDDDNERDNGGGGEDDYSKTNDNDNNKDENYSDDDVESF